MISKLKKSIILIILTNPILLLIQRKHSLIYTAKQNKIIVLINPKWNNNELNWLNGQEYRKLDKVGD